MIVIVHQFEISPLPLCHVVRVALPSKAVDIAVTDMPRDTIAALCDQFKERMLTMYDQWHSEHTKGKEVGNKHG